MSDTTKPLVVWSKPPKRYSRAGGKWTSHIEALHERPGEWACLRRNPKRATLHSMRNSLLRSTYKPAAHPYKLEVVVRRTADGEDFGIWARLTEPTP